MEIAAALAGFAIMSITALIIILKVVVPLFPYSYANARLRAMRIGLLTKEHYEELLRKPYNEIVYSLEKTYPELSSQLGAKFAYASVETALRINLIQTFVKVKKLSPEGTKPFVQAILSKYDTQLIESFVRISTATYAARRDIFFETELFSKDFLTKQNPTIDDLYNQLKHTFYEPVIAKHLEEIKKGQYKNFEEELDLLYFHRLRKTAKSPEAKAYARMLIDHRNIELVLKGLEPIIPHGRIPLTELQGSQGLEDLSKKLQHYGYNLEHKSPELMERDLRRFLRNKGEVFMSKNPLSESTIIGFIILKTTDTRTLNILLKMKYHKFDPEIIREVNLL